MARTSTLEALLAGQAFADLSPWRKVAVTGRDAHTWLGDLVSAEVAGLTPGAARRSLLLSPTGQVRAVFTVTPHEEGLLLIQDPAQPRAIDALLERYVLSSDVVLESLTEEFALFALPGRLEPPEIRDAHAFAPSFLGPGVDLLAPMNRRDELATTLASTFQEAEMEDVEAWRVFVGVPRFGVDVGEEDLPQEGALEGAVSFDKGCYVGQEAVAKVRNLGHPRRVLLHVEASAPVAAGEPVCVDGDEVGRVTSATETPNGTRALVKVRWPAKDGPLSTTSGARLERVP